MSFKNFLYYLTEEDGRSLYKENGVVTSTGLPRPVKNSPQGWDEIAIAWDRIMKYKGLNRNFSLPINFYFDEAFILRDAFYNRNIERKIFLLIQQLGLEYTPTYYKWLYSYLYKGELDFSTFKSNRDRVTISINEGGLLKQFKANENTTYSFPFDSESIDLYMDGILLTGVYKWILPERTTGATGYPMTMVLIGEEQKAPGIAVFTVISGQIMDWGSGVNGDRTDYFLADEIPPEGGTGRFTGIIRMSDPDTGSPAGIILHIFNIYSDTVRDVVPLYSGNEAAEIVIDIEVDVQKGDRFFLEIDEYTLESELVFTISTKNPATTIECETPINMFRKLVGRITGSPDNAQSALLIANEEVLITCGDAIRGIEGAEIKTSIGKFFEDYNTTCFAGLSIDNGKIKIEDAATFFDPSNPIDLGIIKNHEHSYAADLAGSVLKVGSIKPDIEDVNGKFDPNGSSVFTLPITRVAKDIELIGPYKKGPYEIEITRYLKEKPTTDNDNDSEVFVIHGKRVASVSTTGTFTAAGSFLAIPQAVDVKVGMRIKITGSAVGNDKKYEVLAFSNIPPFNVLTLDSAVTDEVGVTITIDFPWILNRDAVVDPAAEVCPSPETIFNVRFTPMNVLKLHGRWLRSILTGFDLDNIKFGSGDKNTKFKAVVGGVTMDEDVDIVIDSLGDRLFYNIYHDIETLVPVELVDLLEANPNRCFKFTDPDLEQEFTGFNIKSGLQPNTLQPQQFKLLSSPLNDLSKLIY